MNYAIEQSMNKSRIFTGSIQDIEDNTNRFYEGAAFGAVHFDGQGQRAGINAALGILDEAQGRCMDYFMQTGEVRQACDYLAKQSGKAKPLTVRFWDGLAMEDQHVRFESTAQTLRAIRQQFGS